MTTSRGWIYSCRSTCLRLLAIAMLPAAHPEARAVDVRISWDYGASGASGFMLYCGPSSGKYLSPVDVGNTQSHTVAVAPGTATYCAVTAYDSSRVQSLRSNEVRIDVPPDAPSASFKATPMSGTAPLSVAFTDLSAGKVTGWSWSFGDGATSGVHNPSHTYVNPGTYSVRLTVSGPGGTATQTGATPISVSSAAGAAELILDAGQSRTSFTGKWCVSSAAKPYGARSLYSCGAGVDTYRWTPSLPVAATYDVYIWWTSHPNRSKSVPVTVQYNGAARTFTANQQVGAGQWQLLGGFPFAAGTTGYVQISDQNGQAAADAVRWVRANAAEIILDSGQARTSFSGAWCASSAPAAYGLSSLYSCGPALDTYRWTPSFPAAGSYDVYIWWTSHSNRSTSVPITVVSRDGTKSFTRDQRVSGGQWQLLGRFSFAAGASGYVEISDRNGQTSADAVRFVPQ